MILRDKDANTGWTSASDGTLEQRYYYCQNWRSDVVAMVTAGGYEVEWVKYSAYGTPFGLPGADTDSDGDCDATDITQIQTWIDASAYDVRGDVDLDGDVDATDKSTAQTYYQGTTSGWNDLSAVGNRKGYAGYEWDQAVGKYHVRNRVLDPVLGRWTRRDPIGYVDGMSLYEYVGSRAVTERDPNGTTVYPCRGNSSKPGYKWCCDEAFRQKPGRGGLTICCGGDLIVCVNDDMIKKFPKPVQDALDSCIAECEPLHCPNFKCKKGFTGSPEPKQGEDGKYKSECQVNTCARDCMLGECGGSKEHCTLCNGDPNCEAIMKRLQDKYEDNMAKYCVDAEP